MFNNVFFSFLSFFLSLSLRLPLYICVCVCVCVCVLMQALFALSEFEPHFTANKDEKLTYCCIFE